MNLIVAVDENWAIGYLGRIQWNIKEDMSYFRNKTLNKTVVMGRKTLESFKEGKPLKHRNNMVLTRDTCFEKDDVTIVTSVAQVLESVKNINPEDVFIIGGQSVYEAFLPYCDKAYVTKVHGVFSGDKYFSNLDESDEWTVTHKSDRLMTQSGVHITFLEYERK